MNNLSADEMAIRRIDSEMVAAMNQHNVEAWLSHFASDARMMPPGSPPVVGKEAIRQLVSGWMSPELQDRKSTRLNSSHVSESRMPSSA